MSGGKGGSKTTETTIPDWIKDPAIRNLQRAEDVQRIEYMPYYGADVAAFTPTQNAAFDANIGAAESFGLLAPNTLTATSGMPTPTDFEGFTGYSSQPMYESALAELKANQPDAVAQYDALFGSNVPTTWGGGGGGGFRGSANVGITSTPTPTDTFTPNYDTSTWSPELQKTHAEQISPTSTVSESDNAYRNLKPTRDYSAIKNQLAQERAAGVGNYAPSPNVAPSPHLEPITFTPRNVATLNAPRNAVATPAITQVARAPGGQALNSGRIVNMTFGNEKNFPKNPLGGSY